MTRRRPSSPPRLYPLRGKMAAFKFVHARVNGGTFDLENAEHVGSLCAERCKPEPGIVVEGRT